MTGFSFAAAALILLALAIVLLPLRRRQLVSRAATGSVIVMCLIAIPVYWQVSTWDFSRPPTVATAGQVPDIGAMVGGLEARLNNDPTDVEGWTMLGRSYVVLFLRPGIDGVILSDGHQLGTFLPEVWDNFSSAQAFVDQSSLKGDAGVLVEEVLAERPMEPRALWYGGMAALLNDRRDEARDRWTKLLSLNPPPAVAAVLQEQLAQFNGGDAVAAAADSPEEASQRSEINVSVSLAEGAANQITTRTMLFIIARNPGGGPPVAVTRHSPSALPGAFTLTDANALLPGSSLAQFPKLEVVVRLSLTGEPIAKPGDWYASTIVEPGAEAVELLIDQQVD